MNFGRLVDRLTKKDWTDDEVERMVGPATEGYLTYANDEAVRNEAASGGTTSALMIHALDEGLIDGAIVCQTCIEDGKVRARFKVARTAEEVLAARGSKYVETAFLREVLPLLRSNEGRFAVCGLPCDIMNLRRWEEKEPALSERIAYRIAFLCGHNSRKELIDGVVGKLSSEAGGAKLTDFRFRTGHWRGKLTARFDNGDTLQKPFSYFSDYRNLHFFSERKCMACSDHFGYSADLSIGDVWLYNLRNDPVKHSGVLTRNETADALIHSAVSAGVITSEAVGRRYILDGQTRIAPTHYNVTARAKAGRLLGVKLNDTVNMPAPFLKFASAFLGLWNMRVSEGPHAARVFKVPRPLIKGYLYFKKGLESLR